MSVFDWNDLKYFLAVARTGSTLAAAKALGLSQSTVQRRLVALEKCLARRLVEHHPTGYRLTPLGQEVLAHAKRVEEAVEAFERHLVSRDHRLAGTLRVTCPEGLAPRVAAPLVEAFQAKYPALRVELMMTDRNLDLAKGDVDVAFRAHDPGSNVLVARKLVDAPWAVYASRAYVGRHGRPQRIEDIERHAVIEFSGEMRNNHAGRWLRAIAPRARIGAHGNTMLGLIAAVKSGAGLAPLPVVLAEPESDLVRVLDAKNELDSRIYLVMHPDLRHTPRVRAFVDFVVAEIEKVRPLFSGRLPRS
ncbi:MAG TPA: LysR family transcriptional regulator [Hyphomicrobiaceae bacterium]|jgi:DNA-binding transcriptional LysR family regulator